MISVDVPEEILTGQMTRRLGIGPELVAHRSEFAHEDVPSQPVSRELALRAVLCFGEPVQLALELVIEADRGRGLPSPSGGRQPGGDCLRRMRRKRAIKTHATSLTLSFIRRGLIPRLQFIEGVSSAITFVTYTRGTCPNVPKAPATERVRVPCERNSGCLCSMRRCVANDGDCTRESVECPR